MKKLYIVLAIAAVGFSACTSNSGTGNFSLYLTDLPTDAKALNITIDKIYLYPPDGVEDQADPVLIYDRANDPSENPGEVNLLELTDGQKELITTETVPAGNYGQIRMILIEPATIVLEGSGPEAEDDITETVVIPSREPKIPYPISIEEGSWTKVTLDFDADKSLHINETGSDKYVLRPVIHVTEVVFGSDGS